ncbi:hypothetical protein BDP27DRAFT_1220601, partial [Rhodocollybia butyracea]
LFLYDWMLLLPVELDVVWSEKLQPLNVLYIIQRYMPFVDTIGLLFAGKDDCSCLSCAHVSEVSSPRTGMYITGIALTEVVLAMRTQALWGKDIRLTVGLTIFFVGCWVPNFYIVHRWIDSETYMPSPLPWTGCVILGGKPILFLGWVILMVYKAGQLMYVLDMVSVIHLIPVILTLMLIPGFAYCVLFFSLSMMALFKFSSLSSYSPLRKLVCLDHCSVPRW